MDFELGRKGIVEWAEEAPEEQAAADFTPAQEKLLEIRCQVNPPWCECPLHSRRFVDS